MPVSSSIRCIAARYARGAVVVLVLFLAAAQIGTAPIAAAQGIAAIQNVSSTPFVTGITPIIGSRGGVGGVWVDADGVVGRVGHDDLGQLRASWSQVADAIDGVGDAESDFRVVSLARLDRALARRLGEGKPITPDMAFLAGLRRIEYVFAVPPATPVPGGAATGGDILIAGPGGPWKANQAGEVVGVADGRAVLRLDDLMDALRIGTDGVNRQISCSIEPTDDGLRQYARVQARLRTFTPKAAGTLEKAIGHQQVLINGIAPDSHFAHVMLAADYAMKRLAMGLDAAPIDSMPSYLELLQRQKQGSQVTSPRWWMATDYDPLRCTPDRLAWQIRGRAVRTMTQDSLLTTDGRRTNLDTGNPLAQQWSDTMTDRYDELSTAMPVFADLRNCFDLAVLGALMANEGLPVRADCQFEVLTDASRLTGPRYHVPKTIPSVASTLRGRQGWIISVSGGVSIDAWSVVNQTETDQAIATMRSKAIEVTAIQGTAIQGTAQRWWW
ncbi:hypothetical protein Mal15_16440 [Stieleria maiorica]|uniref:DUF1598 domain-containing protein n=1 Tax=Stieleria maiorica TaxID=2795974 RepID=A0A5B9MA96_9BACT|nr:DUF1598 domain-containing protein [Stieleria maiorica]QEF97603.1 hypothetical protein Mal15_16440 [Stieleria maiorica]